MLQATCPAFGPCLTNCVCPASTHKCSNGICTVSGQARAACHSHACSLDLSHHHWQQMINAQLLPSPNRMLFVFAACLQPLCTPLTACTNCICEGTFTCDGPAPGICKVGVARTAMLLRHGERYDLVSAMPASVVIALDTSCVCLPHALHILWHPRSRNSATWAAHAMPTAPAQPARLIVTAASAR